MSSVRRSTVRVNRFIDFRSASVCGRQCEWLLPFGRAHCGPARRLFVSMFHLVHCFASLSESGGWKKRPKWGTRKSSEKCAGAAKKSVAARGDAGAKRALINHRQTRNASLCALHTQAKTIYRDGILTLVIESSTRFWLVTKRATATAPLAASLVCLTAL